jgi:hypothetical protein
VIDELVVMHLERRLADAPRHIEGVVAPRVELPSGSSFRVVAERALLAPPAPPFEETERSMDGAVLPRPSIVVEAEPHGVRVNGGPLLVEPAATCHDPARPTGELVQASPLGQPPFPWRPLALFLQVTPDLEAARWMRDLVNDLLRHDVEARLATTVPVDGPHLTGPCLPTEASVRALEPDIVVALDHAALASAPGWCGANRSTVLVDATEGDGPSVELVSWNIGGAQGRLRARVGRSVTAPDLADLFSRLCAGPHPIAPR